MRLERPQLFSSGRERLYAALAATLLLLLSLSYEYYRYSELTRFDDAVVDATVLHQYVKEKKGRSYTVLKLRHAGVTFYSSGSAHLRDLRGRTLQLQLKTQRLDFLSYLKGFYVYSSIEKVYPHRTLQEKLRSRVAQQHSELAMGALYGALFSASPMPKELREQLSALGVSHLLAISGFHLGVIALVLYGVLTPLYTQAQQRWFPYRNRRRDLFIFSALIMFAYLWILGFVPSLLRAFGMLVVGYVLYDRGLKVISMQTLLITITLLLACWPRLAFSLGFWLSVGGVFYIFLFLSYFGHWKKRWQLLGVSAWVYLMMLPIALYLFEVFSLWHPFSVVWTLLFNLFYPLVALLHLFGIGDLLDGSVRQLLLLGESKTSVTLPASVMGLYLLLSLAAVRYKQALLFLALAALTVFVGAVYQVA